MVGVIVTAALIIPLAGCAVFDSFMGDVKGRLTGQAFTMTGYDNNGNETMTAHGSKVGMEGNEVISSKTRSSESSDSSTSTSLSSVVTITMDGKEIESCGDTLVFNEDGLNPVKNYAKEKTQLSSSDNGDFTNNTLIAKPLNRFKNAFGKSRIVVIKSQLGDPIEAFQGDNVYWEVRSDLPKTTKLEIDGKALYIHRANFQIIDTSLLDTYND